MGGHYRVLMALTCRLIVPHRRGLSFSPKKRIRPKNKPTKSRDLSPVGFLKAKAKSEEEKWLAAIDTTSPIINNLARWTPVTPVDSASTD